ncbi:apolipoprotein N-acyltransferase [Roseovarius aestuariivivens]|uniref:apolipoprotein N-acyltransferase n=1 Tax=Roseovarius aestuariivivens TaxID=1888910 RepID=UPI001081C9B0
MSLRRRLFLAGACGAAAALGQAPWGLWPLSLLALGALYGLFGAETGWRRAALLGLVAGTGHFLIALSWIVEPFLVDPVRHGWMAPFALVFLSAGMGLFWALALGIARAAGGGAAAVLGAFVLAEALRGWLFTGFPWAQVGHVLIDTDLRFWSSLGGAPVLTVLALVGAVAAWHVAFGRRGAGALGLVALAALYIGGGALMPVAQADPEAPVVRLIQPNAAQHEKWDPEMMPVFFDRQLRFTAAPGGGGRPDLIVWPETAVPTLLNRAGPTLSAIAAAAQGSPVMLGLRRVEGARIYNSLVVIDDLGLVTASYDKHHLVPFGEYMPFGALLGRLGIHGLAAEEGGGYSAGPGPRLIDLGSLGQGLPLICYEGVFARNVAGAAARPDAIFMITNDAWFGQVSGPYQHLAQARLRSAEQGLPMVRVANTGVSAVIDAAGRVVAQIPLGEAGWRDIALPGARAPTLYARTGDLPLWALAFLALLAARLHAGRVKD